MPGCASRDAGGGRASSLSLVSERSTQISPAGSGRPGKHGPTAQLRTTSVQKWSPSHNFGVKRSSPMPRWAEPVPPKNGPHRTTRHNFGVKRSSPRPRWAEPVPPKNGPHRTTRHNFGVGQKMCPIACPRLCGSLMLFGTEDRRHGPPRRPPSISGRRRSNTRPHCAHCAIIASTGMSGDLRYEGRHPAAGRLGFFMLEGGVGWKAARS